MFRFTLADVIVIWMALLMLPLGIWKLIEIIIWICHHIHWG